MHVCVSDMPIWFLGLFCLPICGSAPFTGKYGLTDMFTGLFKFFSMFWMWIPAVCVSGQLLNPSASSGHDFVLPVGVMTVTCHPVLCTPSRVYTQPCSPWTCPDPTWSTPGPFRPLSSPSCALCSICNTYVSVHDALLFLSISCEHRWPITNTHDQMQITELAPKLARASTTPRTRICARALPPLLTISLCSSFVIISASLVPGLTSVP